MRFSLDNWLASMLGLSALALAGWHWLRDHPQHNPFAPLSLDDPPGWATARKLSALRDDPGVCRAFLARSGIAFVELPPAGDGECRREDRTVLAPDPELGLVLRPAGAQATCAVGAGLALWLRQGVQPGSQRILGTRVVALSHYGTSNCRRIAGGGGRSEHASGNAIDIAGFALADGSSVTLRRDWNGTGPKARFLRAARDAACGAFGTVLSPDYNAAHADHLHLDQAASGRGWSFCR